MRVRSTVLSMSTSRTGNLSTRRALAGWEIWEIDLSRNMLRRARAKLPAAHLLEADLSSGLPDGRPESFDRIVPGYVFQHFGDPTKIDLILQMTASLTDRGLLLVTGIAFETDAQLLSVRASRGETWDLSEHGWVANRMIPSLIEKGLAVRFEPFPIGEALSSSAPESDG